MLGARLDRLGPAAKRVAQVASVVGRQFRAGDLGELLEGESLELTDALDELQERGVVHQKDARASDEYRFGESLTQEVAYESLLLRELVGVEWNSTSSPQLAAQRSRACSRR